MRRALTALALLLGLPLSVVACLWDRDTPADESPATASAEGMRQSPGWRRSGRNWTGSTPRGPR
jgi:hypothetical protein